MIFDKLTMFAENLSVPTTANGATYSKPIDLRLCGDDFDSRLKVYAQVVGAVNATGSVTTVIQTSDTGASWTDVASSVQDGDLLFGAVLPKGLKRFVRLAFRVGGTALGSAIKVTAGLLDELPSRAFPKVQTFPPLQDLVPTGEAVSEPLSIGSFSGGATAGTAADFTATIESGVVAGMESADSTLTYTVSGSTLTVSTTTSTTAATKTVVFVGASGNKVTKTLTVAS